MLPTDFFAICTHKTWQTKTDIEQLPAPEDPGSSGAIINFNKEGYFFLLTVEQTIIKKKRPGMAHF